MIRERELFLVYTVIEKLSSNHIVKRLTNCGLHSPDLTNFVKLLNLYVLITFRYNVIYSQVTNGTTYDTVNYLSVLIK